jgi:hypothetical protein
MQILLGPWLVLIGANAIVLVGMRSVTARPHEAVAAVHLTFMIGGSGRVWWGSLLEGVSRILYEYFMSALFFNVKLGCTTVIIATEGGAQHNDDDLEECQYIVDKQWDPVTRRS